MSAVASNAESAQLVGIRTNMVLMMSWGLAAAIGALGGVVFAGINHNVNLGLMFTVFIYGSAAATLGGFDSPGGAVIGGLIIGVIENMAAGYADQWVGQQTQGRRGAHRDPRRAARETVRPVRHGEGRTRMKPRFTIRSGGGASWAMRLAVTAVIVVAMFWIPTQASNGVIDTCITALTLMAAAMSLNLLLGYTGQISIGHSAFFGIGAYTTGILVSNVRLEPVPDVRRGVRGRVRRRRAGVAAGAAHQGRLPRARHAGARPRLPADHQVRPRWSGSPVARAAWTRPASGSRGRTPRTRSSGGTRGATCAARTSSPSTTGSRLVIVIAVYLVCRGVVKSRVGRSLVAIRDNETAAAVMGVNLAVTKGLVFGISAACARCLGACRRFAPATSPRTPPT